MKVSRRCVLKSGSIALVGLGTGVVSVPGFLARAAVSTGSRGKTLVVVFQRGAADGLNVVVPHGERAYYKARPTIAIDRPKKGAPGGALDLDGFFGLHPSLTDLKELYEHKTLAVVHAVGSPDATRSHFDAQDFMESGTPGIKSTRDGWLNRYLQAAPLRERESTFRAVATTSQLPRMLAGRAGALAIPQLAQFGLGKRRGADRVQRGLEELYRASGDALLAPTAQETFEAADYLERLDPSGYRPANGASYPRGDLGRSLSQIAQLIKSGVGLEIAFAEAGGWDHHVNEGGAEGQLANLLRQFGRAVGAFARDLGDRMSDVVLVSMSEFGRTVRENGSRGTDHGHANAMFVVGGGVEGGKVYGKWPGLTPERLHEGRDLALTTDFRDVVGVVLSKHLRAADLGRVFPGYAFDEGRFRGLI